MDDWGLLPWVVLLGGAAATYVWRGLGVAVSGQISTADPVFDWVACIAYALLAGLISRMILLPVGALQGTPLEARLASAAVAVAVYYLARKNLLAGILAGTASMIVWIW